jgi:hypothetical protein
MSRFLLWSLVIVTAGTSLAPMARAEEKKRPASKAEADLAAQKATQTAQDVFEGEDFWWKRTQQLDVAVPSMTWLRSFLEKVLSILKWIWDFITSLFRWELGLGNWSFGVLVLWLLVVVLAAWILWKLARWLRMWWAARGVDKSSAEKLLAQERLPEAHVLLDQAAQALQMGQYSEALRFSFLALLAGLQHRGCLRFDPARTNREYKQDLQPKPHLLSVFDEVARPYERVWYGRYPAQPSEAERALSLAVAWWDRRSLYE